MLATHSFPEPCACGDSLRREKLRLGFFIDWGWPNPPSPETHLQILNNSYRVWLALDEETRMTVGFINAICEADVQPFYERAGMRRAEGMIQRNYANQSGRGVRS